MVVEGERERERSVLDKNRVVVVGRVVVVFVSTRVSVCPYICSTFAIVQSALVSLSISLSHSLRAAHLKNERFAVISLKT